MENFTECSLREFTLCKTEQEDNRLSKACVDYREDCTPDQWRIDVDFSGLDEGQKEYEEQKYEERAKYWTADTVNTINQPETHAAKAAYDSIKDRPPPRSLHDRLVQRPLAKWGASATFLVILVIVCLIVFLIWYWRGREKPQYYERR